MGGHKDVVVVDVQLASVCDSLPQLAGVGLAEGHNVTDPLRVRNLKHQCGRIRLVCEESKRIEVIPIPNPYELCVCT